MFIAFLHVRLKYPNRVCSIYPSTIVGHWKFGRQPKKLVTVLLLMVGRNPASFPTWDGAKTM